MKTRKSIIVVVFIFLAATGAAQLYIGTSCGYGLAMAKDVLGYNGYSSPNNNSGSVVMGSYGKGFIYGLNVGYALRENLAIETDINHLISYAYVSKSISDYPPSHSELRYTRQARSYRLTPMLRISFGEKKWKPFVRAGFTMGIFNRQWQDNHNESNNGLVTDYRFENRGGISWGFAGGAGVMYVAGAHFSVSAEATACGMSWMPRRGSYVSYTANGVDQLAGMSVYSRETEYVETVHTNSPTDYSKPRQMEKISLPMSSAGFSIGVHFII